MDKIAELFTTYSFVEIDNFEILGHE